MRAHVQCMKHSANLTTRFILCVMCYVLCAVMSIVHETASWTTHLFSAVKYPWHHVCGIQASWERSGEIKSVHGYEVQFEFDPASFMHLLHISPDCKSKGMDKASCWQCSQAVTLPADSGLTYSDCDFIRSINSTGKRSALQHVLAGGESKLNAILWYMNWIAL